MGENTKIEWAHHTFNPWIGCAKVSDGCKNCYAETMMDTRYKRVKWGVNGTRARTSDAYWTKPLQWDKAAAKAGERHRVFCASLADVFEDREERDPWRIEMVGLDVWRLELLDLIRRTPNLDWLLLTKRPENILQSLNHRGFVAPIAATGELDRLYAWLNAWLEGTPPANVWLGTSVEDQDAADERIPHLLKVPARVRFLSCEPLLGKIDLSNIMPGYGTIINIAGGKEFDTWAARYKRIPPIHWVIAGGESGPKARPMHPEWVHCLRWHCRAAKSPIPFFFKQWGEHNEKGEKVGKKDAGRLLDGREWNEVPNL